MCRDVDPGNPTQYVAPSKRAETVTRICDTFDKEAHFKVLSLDEGYRDADAEKEASKLSFLNKTERARLADFLADVLAFESFDTYQSEVELAKLSCRRCYCLKEVASWLAEGMPEGLHAELGLPGSERWMELAIVIGKVFREKHDRLPHSNNSFGGQEGARNGCSVVFDKFQEDWVETVIDEV